MKVAAQSRYGGPEVISVVDWPKPEPGPGEVLVQVHASTVTLADCAFRKAEPFIVRFFAGLFRPKIAVLGDNIAGIVEAVGAGVTRFRPGDRVFGSAGLSLGGMAEYVVLPEGEAIVVAPEGHDLPALGGIAYSFLTAMPFIRDEARVKRGDRVLINGAASSVGAIAVQLARHYGAHVTAVASQHRHAMLAAMGADALIDRHAEDFTQRRAEFDVVFDAVGKSSFARSRLSLKPGGIYLTTTPSLGIFWLMLTGGRRGDKRGKLATTGLRPVADKRADMQVLAEMLAAGTVKPVTDRRFPLAAISEAHRYVEQETKAGDVLVEMPVVTDGRGQAEIPA